MTQLPERTPPFWPDDWDTSPDYVADPYRPHDAGHETHAPVAGQEETHLPYKEPLPANVGIPYPSGYQVNCFECGSLFRGGPSADTLDKFLYAVGYHGWCNIREMDEAPPQFRWHCAGCGEY